MIRSPAPLLALILLAGCAEDRSGYPSLAPRPVEKAGFEEPERAPVTVAPDPALDTQVAEVGDKLTKIAAGFDRDAANAARFASAAKAQPVGSEAWLSAQSALATLDDWRAQTSAQVSDIESLALNRAATLKPAYPALDALQERAHAEADRQAATIQRLQNQLPAA